MIFGTKEKSIILTHTMYWLKDWFCAPGSQIRNLVIFTLVWELLNAAECGAHLFDLVARAGDSLCDALVGSDRCGELCVVLNYQLIKIMITLLIGLLQTALLRLSVLHILTAGQCPDQKIMNIC